MNNLIEIAILDNYPDNIKNSKHVTKIIDKTFENIKSFELFTCGIQQKNNKIRILCNSETWINIKDKIYNSLTKTELAYLGYTYIN